MIVDESILAQVCEDAGYARLQRAKDYVERRKIRIEEIDYNNKYNFIVSAKVFGSQEYETHIEVKGGEVNDVTCTCEDYHNNYGSCKHIVATLIYFNEKTDYRDLLNGVKKEKETVNKEIKYRGFNQILSMLLDENTRKEYNEIKALTFNNKIRFRTDFRV